MARKIIQMDEGSVYGRLTVIGRGPDMDGNVMWLCECSCGNYKHIKGYQLRNGRVVSCGCQHREAAARNIRKGSSARRLKHGEARLALQTPEWKIWQGMRSSKVGHDPAWESYEGFLAGVGRRPAAGLYLCRPDTGRPYGPDNFIWQTAKWRAQNRRKAWSAKQPVIFLQCRGERLALRDWSERSGVAIDTIRGRIRNGWTVDDAIFTEPSISGGLKRSYAAGRIEPRKPIYTKEERRLRNLRSARLRWARDPEKSRAKMREWYRNNPDKKRSTSQKYLDKHRDRLNAKARADRTSPERKAYMLRYAAKHRRQNPDLYISYAHNRRGRLMGSGGVHTEAEWFALVAEFNGCCAYCGDSMTRMRREHRVPLVRGGSNDISNILPSCGPCNSSKGSLTEDEFRLRLAGETVPIDDRWRAQLAEARAARRARSRGA
jgi:hypothetical protein